MSIFAQFFVPMRLPRTHSSLALRFQLHPAAMTFYYQYGRKKKPQTHDGFFSESAMTVNTTKVFDIESVVDPKTSEEMTAKEAVKRGIIDEATGRLSFPHLF